MNKVLLLITMMFFMINSYGQDQKEFIEVIVEDSLEVEPEEIFYMVVLSPHYFNSDTSEMENSSPVTIKPTIKESELEKLYNLISRMKIDTVAINDFNILTYRESEKTFMLHFKSKLKLQEFVKEAKKLEGLMGSISRLNHSRIEMYNQQLTKKLLAKAKFNATFTAEQSGKKPGRLLQVKEEQSDEQQGGWTMYPPLSALAQANFPNVGDKIILNKKLVVRYAW